MPTAAQPKRFTIITAVYNVARYLPDFMASIEAQDFDLTRVEIIAVDDGSNDDSLQVLQAWQDRLPEVVKVFTKANGGQGSARNLGLEHATGEWITFPDPDDVLAPDYLTRVDEAITGHPKTMLVATNRLIWQEATGELSERHPLRKLFAHRDEFKNLDGFPENFHGSAPAAFFRREIIEEIQLRFDERIRPNFEDGHFCQIYLLSAQPPVVGFLKSAHYHYRKRADQSSTLQTGRSLSSRFTDVPLYGYLDALRRGAEAYGGRAPEWLQNMIIYELSHYISPEDDAWTPTSCVDEVAATFRVLLKEIRAELDDDVIKGFTTRPLRPEWRQLLLHGLSGASWHTPYVVMHRYDARREQVLLSYRYMGREPEYQVWFRGKPIAPKATKIRAWWYFDSPMMRERFMWVPASGTVRVRLDDRFVDITTSWRENERTAIRPAVIRQVFNAKPPTIGVKPPHRTRRERITRKLRAGAIQARDPNRWLLRLARTRPVRAKFAKAWVFMDWVSDCGDSAERLFDYVRLEHPGINAWFVLQEGTPDWHRLKASGHNRLVAYGSREWKLLLLNCKHMISSHVDVMIVRPPAFMSLGVEPKWKNTFLQHGVIKDNLSGWLNPKPIDLFITSTAAEYHSIVDDDSTYVYTEKEVKLTGLPRFDRLRELSQNLGSRPRRMILVAPTWRDYLNLELKPGEYRRGVSEFFAETDYGRNWLGLLKSPRLERLCREEGLTIGFLPHPNVQAVLSSLNLPPHVEPLSYADQDVQRLFAKALILVTDYSSIAFNAAYVDNPVVYFQFDREAVERGEHRGRKGYFDYRRDGFGPVTETLDDAVNAIVEVSTAGPSASLLEPYAARVAAAFPDRDGNCCKRTFDAIKRL